LIDVDAGLVERLLLELARDGAYGGDRRLADGVLA